MELKLHKLIGLCYATDELLRDATALGNVITQGYAEEFGFLIDEALYRGSGAGQPLGVLKSPCLVSVAKGSEQASGTIITENILDIWNRVPVRNRLNGKWYINLDIEPQLQTMDLGVGTGGLPVYLPPGGLSGTPFSVLLGKPVMPIEQCSVLGTQGDIMFADFSQYLTIEKDGIDAATSIHVAFVTDETAFRFVYRIDGQPTWGNSIAAAQGGTRRSPFVTLDARP